MYLFLRKRKESMKEIDARIYLSLLNAMQRPAKAKQKGHFKARSLNAEAKDKKAIHNVGALSRRDMPPGSDPSSIMQPRGGKQLIIDHETQPDPRECQK